MDDFARNINNRYSRRVRRMEKAGFIHRLERLGGAAAWEDKQAGIIRYMSDAEFNAWFLRTFHSKMSRMRANHEI
jgi:hypothetical protein